MCCFFRLGIFVTHKGVARHNNKRLLLSTVKLYSSVSPQTLGHLIQSLLPKAGIDTDQFSAYSTRHATVSDAKKKVLA